jgi:hypothetical protein
VGRPRKHFQVQSTGQPKKCPCCQQWYPATTEYFPLNLRFKTGLHSYCRPCTCLKGRNYYRRVNAVNHMTKGTTTRPYNARRNSAESLSYMKLGTPANIPAEYGICPNPFCMRVFPDTNQFFPHGGECYLCEIIRLDKTDGDVLTIHETFKDVKKGMTPVPIIPPIVTEPEPESFSGGYTEEELQELQQEADEMNF